MANAKEKMTERDVRIQKLQEMRTMGVNPYAKSFDKRNTIDDLIKISKDGDIETLKNKADSFLEEGAVNKYLTAGRMISFRTHGRLSFAKLRDATGDIQLCFVRDLVKLDLGKDIFETLDNGNLSVYKFIQKYIDVGDFIGVRGDLFVTKHGELTLFVNELKFLSKAIRPLPEKRHGLTDTEACYRQRYLDLVSNDQTYQRFRLRANFIKTLRQFYWKNGFSELDCPVLTPAASGAAAKTFKTHHNAFDTEFFLRICNETELKKATIGRFENVFTFGTNFRNEGSDPSHLQEFMMLEHQAVYKSFQEDMSFTEKMFDYIFDELDLDRVFEVKDKEGNPKQVDFTTPWDRIDYVKGVNEASGLDITSYGMDDADKLRNDIKSKGIEFEGMNEMGTMTLIDYLFKKVLRPKIVGPVFVYNYPRILAPLARISDEDPNKCEKWQVIVNGWEIVNSYGELVDPLKQQEQFIEQSKAEADGDEEATSADNEFVKAMEYGMPIQAGFGMGIDRILALITQQDNLRDVVLFPLMKPEFDNTKKESDECESGDSFCKKTSKKEFSNNEIEVSLDIVKKAEGLASKYLTDTHKHCVQVGQIMRFFAKKLGKNESLWYITGLLHDVDRDHIGKDGNKHLGEEFDKIMDELKDSFDNESEFEQLKNDLRSHAHFLTGVQPETLSAKYLCAVDELSGLIYAYSLMRPTGLEGLKAKSIKKKIKDKSFAAGVDREEVRNCEKFLGLNLDDFITDVIEGMQG